MKKIKFTYGFFFVIVSFVILSSCSSEQSFIEDSQKPIDISNIYSAASSEGANINSEAMGIVNGKSSRATSKEDIVGYLLSLSAEEIDSLYIALNVNDTEDLDDFAFNAKLDSLMATSPTDDIAQLCYFMDDYISTGGHSIQHIEQGIQKIKTPNVQTLAISSAAIYDNITSEETANTLVVNSESSRSCVYQLAFDLGGIAIGVASDVMSAYSGDEWLAVIGGVHDVIDLLRAIRKYKLCERLNSWR